MKKLFWLGIYLSCATFSYGSTYDWSQTMTGDSKTLTISTTTSSPTQILTKDSYVQRTYIVNTSTFTIFISSVSSNISTTTSFGIPGVSAGSSVIFTPDGTNAPYEGAMWAVTTGQTPPSISIFRSK
jgi:hypothetical protein